MYKIKLNSLIRLSQKNYLSKRFTQEKNNIKGTWKLINSLLNKRKQKSNPTFFVKDEIKITSSKDIADAFNNFFVDIGNRLAGELPVCDTAFEFDYFLTIY